MVQGPAPDRLWPLVPVTAFLASTSLLAYFVFRIYAAAVAQSTGRYQLGLAWFFIVVELFTLVPTLFLFLLRICVWKRPRRPILYAEGDDLPAIDVMITCCGEENNLILNVVRAACESDYPKDRLKVILLDDGHSKELEDAISRLQSTKYPYVYYNAREKPEKPDYKAGNLNAGFKFSAGLSTPPAPFVAGLDTDMVVKPGWLRSMIPHLMQDDKLGMTNPPQYFYNIPRNDHVRQDLDYFYSITELIHEGLNAADCVGSGYVVRRKAIEEIGGIPTASISEDTGTSAMLLGRGWTVAYIDEILQVGEMPDTLMGHVKQRTRWTIGNIQMACHIKFRLWGDAVKNCTIRQRLAGFVFGATSLVNSSLAILGFFGLPLALLSGYPFVVYSETWHLIWLLRIVSISVFCDFLHKVSLSLYVGYRDGMRWEQADSWLFPYFTLSALRGFVLPKNFGGTKPGFVPSGSMAARLSERDPHTRTPLLQRIRIMFFHQGIWFHFLFLLACVLGIILNIVRTFDARANIRSAYGPIGSMSGHDRWVYLLTRIGWPPVYWLTQGVSCLIPIEYMLFPPDEITLEQASDFDEKTGVRYPRPAMVGPERQRLGRWSDHLVVLVMAYTVVAFAGSWYV